MNFDIFRLAADQDQLDVGAAGLNCASGPHRSNLREGSGKQGGGCGHAGGSGGVRNDRGSPTDEEDERARHVEVEHGDRTQKVDLPDFTTFFTSLTLTCVAIGNEGVVFLTGPTGHWHGVKEGLGPWGWGTHLEKMMS